MIAAYYLVGMWFTFMSGAFVHHLITPERVEQVSNYRIGVDLTTGATKSFCADVEN